MTNCLFQPIDRFKLVWYNGAYRSDYVLGVPVPCLRNLREGLSEPKEVHMKRLLVCLAFCLAIILPAMAADKLPAAVTALGKAIAQEQRAVVTPGGTEWAPGYSADDQTAFDKSGKLPKIVARVSATKVFKEGVIAIQSLPAKSKQAVYEKFTTPIYPTWGMNGCISSAGTTNAGYAVEQEIADALTDAVKSAVATEDLGYLIRQAQADVVKPGGSEAAPNFSAADQAAFDGSDKLAKIVNDFKANENFAADVAAFKALPAKTQTALLEKLNTPIYPTWGTLGSVSDKGTTDAGYAVEQEIIAAMIKALKAAL